MKFVNILIKQLSDQIPGGEIPNYENVTVAC